MIEFIAMMGKLAWLLIRKGWKGWRGFKSALDPIGYVVPPMPRKPRPEGRPQSQEPQDPIQKKGPEKYRLVPNVKGTYNLEKFNKETEMYLVEKVSIRPWEADEYIKNLERDTIYYREEAV